VLTKRYMASTKNVPAILDKIIDGTAPGKFTTSHLKTIGFPSSDHPDIEGAWLPLLGRNAHEAVSRVSKPR
jgi:hypothetical protein